MPAQRSRKCPSHRHGSDACADSPAAMQPAHMSWTVVNGNVIIERGIDSARPQSIRECENDQLPETSAGRKPQDCHSGHPYRRGDEFAGAPTPHELGGSKAGNDRASADEHADGTLRRHGRPEFGIHHGPSRAEQRVGQSERHEREIDHGQKQ